MDNTNMIYLAGGALAGKWDISTHHLPRCDQIKPLGACAAYMLCNSVKRGAGDPICLVVTVEIKPELVPQFRAAIEVDAVGSRTEPGCLRFDVLQDKAQDNKFVFYEVYINAEAIEYHKSCSHYAAWTNFKKTGGVLSQTVGKHNGVSFTF